MEEDPQEPVGRGRRSEVGSEPVDPAAEEAIERAAPAASIEGAKSGSALEEAAAAAPGSGAVETGARLEPAGPAPRSARIVRGRVAGLLKGGVEVETPEGPGFCPNAQIALGRTNEISAFLGLELDFSVVGTGETDGRLRLSRRKVLEREARDRANELRRRIVRGARLPGRVVRMTDFGAFVDLGGIEGLVHVSEISHGRIDRPADVLDVGQEVEVEVLRAGLARTQGRKRNSRRGSEQGRVSLSIKSTQEDPWKTAAQRFRPWNVVDGRIQRVTEFGAFLELAPGIEGLLHVSELPPGALEALGEAAQGRPLMAVLVLEVDAARRRVALAPAPGGAEVGARVEPISMRVGRNVTGWVEEIRPDAVLLRLGPGQRGGIPNVEMGTGRGADHKADFPPGTEIEAEVLRIESGGRRARLSRKRAQRRAERAEVERYNRSQSDAGFSTFGDLLARARADTKK